MPIESVGRPVSERVPLAHRLMSLFQPDIGRYLASVAKEARESVRASEIRDAIQRQGYWEDHVEWRISTVTSMRVEPAEYYGQSGYQVTAHCDYRFASWSPTIERAAEMLGVYERLIRDLFFALGWPGWASKNQMTP